MPIRRPPPKPSEATLAKAVDAQAPLSPLQAYRRAVEDLDRLARQMELKWGPTRLLDLVDPDLAARFVAQRERLDTAIREGRTDPIRVASEAMARGWLALDKAATVAGHKPLDAKPLLTVPLPSGMHVHIADTPDHAFALGRTAPTLTLAELGQALAIHLGDDTLRATQAIRDAFPTAGVTIRSKTKAALAPGDLDHEIPF